MIDVEALHNHIRTAIKHYKKEEVNGDTLLAAYIVVIITMLTDAQRALDEALKAYPRKDAEIVISIRSKLDS